MSTIPPKAKLVHIETTAPSAWAFLRGQLRFMRERGYDVTLITSPGPELEVTGAREGVRTIAVPMRREPAPWHDVVSLMRLTSVFRSLRPDIVNVGTPKASLLAGLAGILARVPIRLMTLRGMRADGLTQPARSVMLAMEWMSCRSAHQVYCVSKSLRQRALELKLGSSDKLKVTGPGSGNGVNSLQFSRSPDVLARAEALRMTLGLSVGTPVIGFVGRLVKDKGVAELMAAFRRLQPEIAGLKLLLVGPFEEYDGLPAGLRAEIERDPQIIHLGFVEDPVPAYALMTVATLPTYREGFGNAPMEAAAMELPVVATQVTGCFDAVLHGQTGMLVPARDSTALADALRIYLADADLRRAHGAAGRERVVREFQPEMIWNLLDQEYTELLRQRQTSAQAVPLGGLHAPSPIHRTLLESHSES